ncbi:uncharacterized protein LOC111986786 [Quercus suber]|uniref:Uncharacterized protein n=1 Tax=Quercus suber TaxID=58331 RepID=A0AAW0J8K0_QUESU|nr:uncharacterized protein LOC111986786 [Quercus suber]POE83695.1 hypothetical protein CFP56_31420 [Quercus suber]
MKKLYKKGQVHPSPPSIADHLALLPATILTLTAALSAEDKEVLAYLIISCSNTCTNFSSHTKTILSSNGDGDAGDHTPMFECNCFRCYMSFWARWDASPSRELIHEIIEAYEEELIKKQERNTKSKKERRKRVCNELKDRERDSGEVLLNNEFCQSVSVDVSRGDGDEFVMEKGSVRKIMSFIGERIWGVWNRV